MKTLTLIVPCFNEEENVEKLYRAVTDVMKPLSDRYSLELLYVDDGSNDGTLEKTRTLSNRDPRVKYISFSRNFGKESAMLAGLRHASGDFCGFIDADLQHSPDLIPEMLRAVDEEGYDVAASRRKDREGEGKLKSFLSSSFYRFVNNLSDTKLDEGAQDFRIMNRDVVLAILSMDERVRFTKGIFSWVGFRTKWFPHSNEKRAAGSSKWSIKKLIRYALDGIIAYTDKPLKLAYISGFLSFIMSFACLVASIVCAAADKAQTALGVFILCVITASSGSLLVSVGLLGEYVSRIYSEAKRRPHYIIGETNCTQNIYKKDNNI